jgi:hypothetical protein
MLRILVWLCYRPGLWYLGDSISYLANALHLAPGDIRPSGYSLYLAALRPLHSLALVTATQHLIGVAIASLTYLWMVKSGVRPWLAALATAPLLLDGFILELEQLLLADTLFALLVTIAVVVLFWQRPQTRWTTYLAVGALVGMAGVTRTVGVGLVVLIVGALALLRGSWKSIPAFVLAAALPLVMYGFWFESDYGFFGMTDYSGAFLYARVMPWSTCNGVQLSALERKLCDPRPPNERPNQNWYMWSPNGPLDRLDLGEHARSTVAQDFAIAMITHNPAGYADAVIGSMAQSFSWHENTIGQANTYTFTLEPPILPESSLRLAEQYQNGVPAQTHVSSRTLARLLLSYQQWFRAPGPLYLVAVLTALLGAAFGRGAERRVRVASLSFAVFGTYLLFIAPVTVFYDQRYVLAALPMCCLGFGTGLELVLGRLRPRRDSSRRVGPPSSPIKELPAEPIGEV